MLIDTDKSKTIGSIVSELSQKTPDSLNPREIQRATEKEYIDELAWCVNHAKKKVPCRDSCDKDCDKRDSIDGDFFIEVITKREKILINTLRNYFIPRTTCPAPFFDQTIYRYNSESDDIEFIWVVPDKENCEIYHENRNIVVPAERDLLKNVLAYYDGTLFKMMKQFNGETQYAGTALEEK